MKYASLLDRVQANCYCDPTCGCWLWLGKTTVGRGGSLRPRMNLRRDGKHVAVLAYRVALEAALGRALVGEAGHRDACSTLCCNPAHLSDQSRAENQGQEARRRTAEAV